MRKTRINAWTCLLAVVLLANLVCGFHAHCQEKNDQANILKRLDNLIEVLQIIRQNYVDIDKVSTEALIDSAIGGLVAGLDDQHSCYLPPEEGKWMDDEIKGKFGGVGLILHEVDGFPLVISAIEGTPAKEAGFRPGDVILKIDDNDAQGHSLDFSVMRLRGDVGTEVKITYARENEQEPQTVTLKRALIPVGTVMGTRVLDGTSIGYVRLTQFSEPTAQDLKNALRKLADARVTGLVLDLRGNPGGLLQSAVDICSLFLPNDQLVVTVKGRYKESNFTAKSQMPPDFTDYFCKPSRCPLVILIDGGSASAAEITAGCLRDLKRATLVGEKSYGKGSVQNIMELKDGYSLKLTVAKYYTPGQYVIDRVGLEPDIVSKLSDEDYAKIIRARSEQERAQHDTQLKAAVEFLQNGGKLPDKAQDKADDNQSDTQK